MSDEAEVEPLAAQHIGLTVVATIPIYLTPFVNDWWNNYVCRRGDKPRPFPVYMVQGVPIPMTGADINALTAEDEPSEPVPEEEPVPAE